MDTTNWVNLKWVYLDDKSFLEAGLDTNGIPKIIRYGRDYPIPTTEFILKRARDILKKSISYGQFKECYYRSGFYRAAKITSSLTVK